MLALASICSSELVHKCSKISRELSMGRLIVLKSRTWTVRKLISWAVTSSRRIIPEKKSRKQVGFGASVASKPVEQEIRLVLREA